MPKLTSVEIRNFRMLQEAEVRIEEHTTVIVGRNNSGKTSLSEVILRFCSRTSPSFKLQDFSVSCIKNFLDAYEAGKNELEEAEIRKNLPCIELRLHFEYDLENPNLGELNKFIVDLDPECNEVIVAMKYELKSGSIREFLSEIPRYDFDTNNKRLFYREISKRILKLYTLSVNAEDPNDSENVRIMEKESIPKIIETRFIRAQRGLDDTSSDHDQLAKVIAKLFRLAHNKDDGNSKKEITKKLEIAVEQMQQKADGDFRENVDELLKDLSIIDYPDHKTNLLTTETVIDIIHLLTNITVVRYQSGSDILLPESYNGLGMRNFISILLNIINFYEEYCVSSHKNAAQLVFIEEPESHLHPQMQEIFTKKIDSMVRELISSNEKINGWPVQLLVTTHSPHIANKSNLRNIRYFRRCQNQNESNACQTQVKDLKEMINLGSSEKDEKDLIKFMNLTRCDLYFADKAIIVEGQVERLFLPEMIKKFINAEKHGHLLSNDYITIIEVGGSYGGFLVRLIEFLEIKTLIVADIDPTKDGKPCLFHEATETRNNFIKKWFDRDATHNPSDLINKSYPELEKNNMFLTFQRPENGEEACGRDIEDAFILANREKFFISEDEGKSSQDVEKLVREAAPEGNQKIDFALTHINAEEPWETPRYIKDGLLWLASGFAEGNHAEVSSEKSDVIRDDGEEQRDD